MVKILVVGDAIIDRYEFGTINRKSPEDWAVDVFDSSKIQMPYEAAGGCLNVAANLMSLSSRNDVRIATGLSAAAKARFQDNYGMKFSPGPCSVEEKEDLIKTRLIDETKNQQILRIDTNEKYTSDRSREFGLEFYIWGDYDAIVVSDYNKGLITPLVIDKLSYASCPIFIDTKKHNFDHWRTLACPVVKINDREFSVAENYDWLENIVVTQGSSGAIWRGTDLVWKDFVTQDIPAGNVIGAGDVFLAGLVTEYLRSKDFNEAINFANHVAGISVNKFGTYAVKESELRQKNTLNQLGVRP